MSGQLQLLTPFSHFQGVRFSTVFIVFIYMYMYVFRGLLFGVDGGLGAEGAEIIIGWNEFPFQTWLDLHVPWVPEVFSCMR